MWNDLRAKCAHKVTRCDHALTRRDVFDQFQPQERAVLLQSTALKQACSPYCVGGPAGRLLDVEARAEQLGSTSVQPERLIGARTARAFDRMAPVWPHGHEQVTMLGTLISPAHVSCRNSIRCRQHRALCR